MLSATLQTLEALLPDAPARACSSPLLRPRALLDAHDRIEFAYAILSLVCADCQFRRSRKGCTTKAMSARLTEWSQAAAALGQPQPWDAFPLNEHTANALGKFLQRNHSRASICGLGVLPVPEAELRDARKRFRVSGQLLPEFQPQAGESQPASG